MDKRIEGFLQPSLDFARIIWTNDRDERRKILIAKEMLFHMKEKIIYRKFFLTHEDYLPNMLLGNF